MFTMLFEIQHCYHVILLCLFLTISDSGAQYYTIPRDIKPTPPYNVDPVDVFLLFGYVSYVVTIFKMVMGYSLMRVV